MTGINGAYGVSINRECSTGTPEQAENESSVPYAYGTNQNEEDLSPYYEVMSGAVSSMKLPADLSIVLMQMVN